MQLLNKYFCLIIIESLTDNEKQTGTILHDELIKYKRFQEPNFESQLRIVESKYELILLLQEIINLQKSDGLFPYLHFEMHGHPNGLVLKNGDVMNWSDLIPMLGEINYLTKNYLMLHFGSCYSGSILKSINIEQRAPFKAIIASPYEINIRQIEQGFSAYYDDYFFSFDPKSALLKLNNELNDDVFFLVTIEYCFNRITSFDPQTKRGKEMIEIFKNRLLIENPALKLLPKDIQYQITLTELQKVFNNMKSKREYFLMLDLKKD